jgi:tRNA pseudouridine55 synthase
LIATGNSTKLIPLLESARKEYITTIHLDGKSDSYDMGTPIMPISGEKREKTATEIEDFLLTLTSQTPPKYSALHIGGQRAYDLARK